MIRFRLAELIADHGFRVGRRLEVGELAEATGIHRSTLSRILNKRGSNVTSANMDALCRFFDCSLGDLAEYLPDESVAPTTVAPAPGTPTAPKLDVAIASAARSRRPKRQE
jgi:putative transcriptional regulator